MIVAAQERFAVDVREIKTAEERVVFKLPPMPAARAS